MGSNRTECTAIVSTRCAVTPALSTSVVLKVTHGSARIARVFHPDLVSPWFVGKHRMIAPRPAPPLAPARGMTSTDILPKDGFESHPVNSRRVVSPASGHSKSRFPGRRQHNRKDVSKKSMSQANCANIYFNSLDSPNRIYLDQYSHTTNNLLPSASVWICHCPLSVLSVSQLRLATQLMSIMPRPAWQANSNADLRPALMSLPRGSYEPQSEMAGRMQQRNAVRLGNFRGCS